MKTYFGKQVGFVQVNKSVVYTDNHYECAAWWEERTSKTGVFPLTIQNPSSTNYSKDIVVVANIPGIVTNDYFPALFGGVCVSTQPYKPKYIGQASRPIIISSNFTKAIMLTGNSPGNDIDWYVNPEIWDEYVSYLRGCMNEEYAYLAQSWDKNMHNSESSTLDSVMYSSKRLSQYAKDIGDVSRQIGYLGEASDMWRNLHKQNTSWAK